jgi:hypothetical protein
MRGQHPACPASGRRYSIAASRKWEKVGQLLRQCVSWRGGGGEQVGELGSLRRQGWWVGVKVGEDGECTAPAVYGGYDVILAKEAHVLCRACPGGAKGVLTTCASKSCKSF